LDLCEVLLLYALWKFFFFERNIALSGVVISFIIKRHIVFGWNDRLLDINIRLLTLSIISYIISFNLPFFTKTLLLLLLSFIFYILKGTIWVYSCFGSLIIRTADCNNLLPSNEATSFLASGVVEWWEQLVLLL
jgi:hypothetical protein